ncbi:hypothetical protein RsS62_23630 [Rhizobium dioscoreae]|uniref:hypothetical protein n=1 Tax=Rhizobium TaxID=379 RepID=UPI0011A23F2E|nr:MULTISPECIES: hypothetical protein [Rhizobium]GES43111.1 hypothetical protein RsS62_23630 [Rhizobium dioscoreae]
MRTGNTFNHVKALADDGITVRILSVGDELRASIDFPTFQHPDGKFYKANPKHDSPVSVALSQAQSILPQTPFTHVAVIIDDVSMWRSEWGTLVA